MYRISWSKEQDGGAVDGTLDAQYLPDIQEILRNVFGVHGAKFVVIAKED